MNLSLAVSVLRLHGRAAKAGLSPASFPRRLIAEGMRVEAEHTDDPKIQALIAADHLTEDRDYYRKLRRMEAGACGGLAGAGVVDTGPRITIRGKVSTDYAIRAERVIAAIPSVWTTTLREIVIFPPERQSLYTAPGSWAQYFNDGTIHVAAKEYPEERGFAAVLAHEIGHHVYAQLPGEVRREIAAAFPRVRYGDNASEDEAFAYAFGLYFGDHPITAEATFPREYEILLSILRSVA